jgi:hypothetical protein
MMPTKESPTILIPLTDILPPVDGGALNPEEIERLRQSIEDDGLLHPIGVRLTSDEGPGVKYVLVYGRNRLAAVQQLGREKIEAKVLAIGSEDTAMTALAENVCRNHIKRSDYLLQLKKWKKAYEARHPRQAVSKASPAFHEQPPRFKNHAAKKTGKSSTTIENEVRVAEAMSDENLERLNHLEPPATKEDLEELAMIKDEKVQNEVVQSALTGKPIRKAIAEGKQECDQDQPTKKLEPEGAELTPDADLTDQEWLDQSCGNALVRFGFLDAYKRDASLYRGVEKAWKKFRKAAKPCIPTAQAAQPMGQFFQLLQDVVELEHPKDWSACGSCGGQGQVGGAPCGVCGGSAYSLTKHQPCQVEAPSEPIAEAPATS